MTTNIRTQVEFILSGLDVNALKHLRITCCPAVPEKREGTSKTSVSYLARAIAQAADVHHLRDELEEQGYDVSDFDELISGSVYEGEATRVVEPSRAVSVVEEENAFSVADLNLQELFGKRQAEVLGKLAEKLASIKGATAGPSQHFALRLPEGGVRTVKGRAPKRFQDILDLATASRSCSRMLPIMLVGPAGCGKTTAARMVAEALGLEFSALSLTEGTSESQFTGPLLPIGEGGRFEHVESTFLRLYEHGGVFLGDEMDAADPNVLLIINSALSNNFFPVPTRREKPVAERHRDFVFIGACNTFGQGADLLYAGRNQLDEATRDRFRAGTVEMDYDTELEQEICDAEVLRWGWPLRRKVRENNLRRIVSTRFLEDLSTMKRVAGWGQTRWEEKLFAGWSRDEIARVA